uniref:Uncharacterized protein n=1 Tax=Variovorax sp. HH01 TaxID=1084736 RepID=I3PCN3_9BURK|nr:hypothetical protein var063 [Variovorax sp. HH01]
MKSISPSFAAALAGPSPQVAQLVAMYFAAGVVALNSMNRPLDFGGITYRGAAGLGEIAQINDSAGSEIKGLQLTMSGLAAELLALALADATVVQGVRLVIRLALIGSDGFVIDAPVDWDGYLDTMSIDADGERCVISATAESSAVDLLRGNPMTTSNADQQSLYPGDRVFEYIVSQDGIPVVWPTKQYYIDSR